MLKEEENVCVQLVGDLDDLLRFDRLCSKCGFVVSKGEKSCYVPIGDAGETNEALIKHDDDLLSLFLDLILASNDEVVCELADVIRNTESLIVMNGELIYRTMIDEAFGAIGERD
jgi:hypothetical protein